jgi:hypothetical protein
LPPEKEPLRATAAFPSPKKSLSESNSLEDRERLTSKNDRFEQKRHGFHGYLHRQAIPQAGGLPMHLFA